MKITDARGAARQTVTNAAGIYEVLGLPPGRYTVDIAAPRGLKIYIQTVSGSPKRPGRSEAAELVPNGGASVHFVLTADTRISGRLLDERGEPMSRFFHKRLRDIHPYRRVSAYQIFKVTAITSPNSGNATSDATLPPRESPSFPITCVCFPASMTVFRYHPSPGPVSSLAPTRLGTCSKATMAGCSNFPPCIAMPNRTRSNGVDTNTPAPASQE